VLRTDEVRPDKKVDRPSLNTLILIIKFLKVKRKAGVVKIIALELVKSETCALFMQGGKHGNK
jgi:hypothetical protein